MNVHIATMQQMRIGSIGQPVNPTATTTTYKDMLDSTQWRVVPDSNNPSTGDPNAVPPTTYPTITEYLVREAAVGLKLQYMNQTMVITYDA